MTRPLRRRAYQIRRDTDLLITTGRALSGKPEIVEQAARYADMLTSDRGGYERHLGRVALAMLRTDYGDQTKC